MKLEIIWSEFAEAQVDKIFEYYLLKSGFSVALKTVEGILSETELLIENPSIGQKEPLLAERQVEYQYLLHKNFKIIYSTEQNHQEIRIADVFDTKRFPQKI